MGGTNQPKIPYNRLNSIRRSQTRIEISRTLSSIPTLVDGDNSKSRFVSIELRRPVGHFFAFVYMLIHISFCCCCCSCSKGTFYLVYICLNALLISQSVYLEQASPHVGHDYLLLGRQNQCNGRIIGVLCSFYDSGIIGVFNSIHLL